MHIVLCVLHELFPCSKVEQKKPLNTQSCDVEHSCGGIHVQIGIYVERHVLLGTLPHKSRYALVAFCLFVEGHCVVLPVGGGQRD